MVSQWLFGQDSNDFFCLANNKREKKLIIKELIEKSRIMLDEFQSIIDKNNLCDARHILIEKIMKIKIGIIDYGICNLNW